MDQPTPHERLDTGVSVRPGPAALFWTVLVAVSGVNALAFFATFKMGQPLLTVPAALVAYALVWAAMRTAQRRHNARVQARIRAEHGITIPLAALRALRKDGTATFDSNGVELALSPSHQACDPDWDPRIVITPAPLGTSRDDPQSTPSPRSTHPGSITG